jgi:hypothetical protein
LCSKLCAATSEQSYLGEEHDEEKVGGETDLPSGLIKFCPHFPFSATISPHAPPTFELISNAFHRWYIDVGPGIVPTSRSTQTLGWRIGPKALKNHRWELIFFWFFSLRQKMIWTGTMPFSAPSIFIEGATETRNRVRFGDC